MGVEELQLFPWWRKREVKPPAPVTIPKYGLASVRNLHLRPELLRWAMDEAKARNLTLDQLVDASLSMLRDDTIWPYIPPAGEVH